MASMPTPVTMTMTAPTVITIMPVPVTSIAAIVSIPAPMVPAVFMPVASLVVLARRGGTPMRGRIAQEIDRLAAGVVAAAVAAPVARMAGRHPHIDGLHLRHYRAAPHRLGIQQLRRCITDIDLTVNPRSQLP